MATKKAATPAAKPAKKAAAKPAAKKTTEPTEGEKKVVKKRRRTDAQLVASINRDSQELAKRASAAKK